MSTSSRTMAFSSRKTTHRARDVVGRVGGSFCARSTMSNGVSRNLSSVARVRCPRDLID